MDSPPEIPWPEEYEVPTTPEEVSRLFQQVSEKLAVVPRNDPEARTLHMVAGTCSLMLADLAREAGHTQLAELFELTGETQARLAAAESDDEMVEAFKALARGAQTFAATTDYEGISEAIGEETDRFQTGAIARYRPVSE